MLLTMKFSAIEVANFCLRYRCLKYSTDPPRTRLSLLLRRVLTLRKRATFSDD